MYFFYAVSIRLSAEIRRITYGSHSNNYLLFELQNIFIIFCKACCDYFVTITEPCKKAKGLILF